MNSASINRELGVEEMKSWKNLLKQVFAEFLGTFVFLSLSTLAGTNLNFNYMAVGFANGLLVASVVQVIGHVSGGHINPAITLGVMVCGHIMPLRGLCFVVAQALGSITGSAVAYALSEPATRHNLGATVLSGHIRADQAFGLELIMTFLLVAVALSVLDPRRGARGLGSASLAIGISLTACNCACFLYTGGSLNPVRSLGPAVIMNIWQDHWVYWAGPLCGGLLAGIIHRFVLNV